MRASAQVDFRPGYADQVSVNDARASTQNSGRSFTESVTGSHVQDAVAVPIDVDLAWNANPVGENVTGYRLYYGTATGTYNGSTSPINVGNVTSYTFNPPQSGLLYMALKAVNANGEGPFSNELSAVFS